MKDEEILKIVKSCFRESYGMVTKNMNSAKRNESVNTNTHLLCFSKFNLDLPGFSFQVIHNYALVNMASITSPTNTRKVDREYQVIITRLNHNDDVIFTKKIKTDENFYKELLDLIEYDEDNLETDLNDLVSSIRDRKIDKLTK